MLNRDGVRRTKYGTPKQILFSVEHQVGVGCIVPQSLGVTVEGGKKYALAGTPIKIDLEDIDKEVEAADTEGNAVLIHDVDVTDGAANGSALIFGFVNLNRLEEQVVTKIKAVTNMSKLLTFAKL